MFHSTINRFRNVATLIATVTITCGFSTNSDVDAADVSFPQFDAAAIAAAVPAHSPSTPLTHSNASATPDSIAATADGSMVRVLRPVITPESEWGAAGRDTLIVPITISAVPRSPADVAIDRLVIRISPRKHFGEIIDYWPKTETSASVEGSTLIRVTDEQSSSSGLAVDGAYGSMASAHLGTDMGNKRSQMTETKRLPTLHAAIASGTFNRGGGVIYKLDATRQSVLEGEKDFQICLRVPRDWRGGMMDVSIEATSTVPARHLWESATTARKVAEFAVAVYRDGDPSAALDARSVAATERELWRAVRVQPQDRGIEAWLGSITSRLSLADQDSLASSNWVQRLVCGGADPHHDSQIKRLSVSQRVLAIDYVDAVSQLMYGDSDFQAEQLASVIQKSGGLGSR